MKFILADAMDFVDPHYDFAQDRNSPGRKPYWDDKYPHEILDTPPHDGVLISRGIVGDYRFPGKYNASQQMRFRRVGARKFLRLDGERFRNKLIFGDCGAFSYVKLPEPPYSAEEMVDFYGDGQFTHGCSVDHVIFDYDRTGQGTEGGSEEARRRFEITLRNAEEFLRASRGLGPGFTPLGVVQGWSPGSMAEAAGRLERMGYRYLALGGMVPLNATSIHAGLRAVRETISSHIQLHLLGFAKAEQIHEFACYGIDSFDSTSPLIRAFKDSKANYYVLKEDGGLDYYTAIRVPQAIQNPRLMRAAKSGKYRQEDLVGLEARALALLRDYDRGLAGLEETVEAVEAYNRLLVLAEQDPDNNKCERELLAIRERTERTLREAPWKRCTCAICRAVSIEVVIFRSSNRNKRRGFHNLSVYYEHLRRTNLTQSDERATDLRRSQSAAECRA